MNATRWLLVAALVTLGACAEPPGGDHAMPPGEATLAGRSGAVSCGPLLEVYPVAGPHNGGYDKNALSYTCFPHPGTSPDNSDFLAGDHYGNDIFAALGTPVVAPRSGTVVKVGWNSVGGNRVTIQDACGWQYYHAHLDTIDAGMFVGKAVSAGQKIGTVGKTGNAQGTSPHLHFSIYPDGVYESGIDPFPLLEAVDHTSCGGCSPHCEGSKIVGADCGSGDCAVFGATCVDDALGVRCVFFACPATGSVKVCVDATKIGTCSNGAIDIGDCAAFGAMCSTAGAPEARCVLSFCVDAPTQVPWEHDTCLPDGQRFHCDASGGGTFQPCPGGQVCSAAGGVHCVAGGCPASGEADVCFSDTVIAHCSGGKVTDQGDCGVFGAWCSTVGDPKPHCVSALCVESPQAVPAAHDICFFDGKRYHCDAAGGLTEIPCAAGQVCASEPTVHCQAPCAPVAEVCNGQDDDCDGAVDEDCGAPCVASDEVCNGEDDDCDGAIDEGWGVGEPCTVGEGACASPGVMDCTGDGGATCEAAGSPCDDGDPCTVDGCTAEAGCLHGPVDGCCSDGTPCGPGQQCAGGTCKKALCLPCAGDASCGEGGLCVPLAGGSFCLAPCDGGCPEAFACQTVPATGQVACVPESGDCTCGPAIASRCDGNTRRRLDGCGHPVGVAEACERGCAGGVCCPVGRAAVDGACAPKGPGGGGGSPGDGEVDPRAGDAPGAPGDGAGAGGAGGGFGSVDEVGGVDPTGGAASDGGCAAGAGPAGGLLGLLALLVMRRRSRSGAGVGWGPSGPGGPGDAAGAGAGGGGADGFGGPGFVGGAGGVPDAAAEGAASGGCATGRGHGPGAGAGSLLGLLGLVAGALRRARRRGRVRAC